MAEPPRSWEIEMKTKTVVTLAAAGLALTSCYSSGPPRQLPTVQQAPTVEGSWTDPNGFVSTFAAGRVQTVTTDGSNKVMATGTYTMMPNNVVQISLFSNVKQTTTRADCALVTAMQLNCTSDSGAQFSLARRA